MNFYFSLNSILYDIFEELENEGNYKKNIKIINEAIQLLENYLINGEKNESNIHELFCEYNFIEKIMKFSESKIKAINLQIIKTLSNLISNISNNVIFYYLMSNNFINNIISHCYFIKYDYRDLISYVNFLNILSLKLNLTTLQFLFREDINSFPLLENALKLYNHPDNMIKKTIKNIFLVIIKIDYKPLHRYLCNLPIISYFCFLSCNIKDKIILLSKEIKEIKITKQYNQNFKIILDDIINNLIYLQNIFDINCPKINYIITNCLFYYCIMPFILNHLNSYKNQKNYKIKKSVCIFFINLLLIYIKNENFLNILFTLIFFPFKTNSINKYMSNEPIQPNNYYYDWNQSIKKTSSSFLNYIQYNFNSLFLKSLLYMNDSKYIQVKEIYLKYQKKLSIDDNYDFDKNKEQFLNEIIKDILNKLSCSEISIMSSYHNYLSIGTGINCGISTKSSNLCVIQKMSKFYAKYFNKNENIKNKLIKNNIKDNLFEILFLNKNTNDKNILLINILLRRILYKNQNISKILLKECNIIPGDMVKDEEISYILNLNKNQKFFDLYKKNSFYNSKSINIYDNYSNEITNSKFNKNNLNNNKKEKNNLNDDKENYTNNLNAQYFETDIFKNTKVSNTLISINEFINNSNNTITEKSKKNPQNIDNNKDNDTININKEKKDEYIIKQNSIEPNLPKNKYSPFDDEYFNNFENNLYLFSSQYTKLSYEHYYNEELINILIKLLDINSNIKILTFKIIIDNILSMVISKKNNNYINNNILYQCFITQKDKNKIGLIYEKYKKEIINNYNNKKSFHNNAYKIFIKQYDKYFFLNNFDYDKIINEGFILLSNNIDIFEENIIIDFEKLENKYEKNVILFILIHDFYYLINSYDIFSYNKNKQEKIYNNLYINNFPLVKRKGLELNKQYCLIDLDSNSNIKYYNCRCKINKNQDNDKNEFIYSYLLIYDNFLYIGDSSNNSNYTIIKYKFLISSCSILSDNYNNKNIIICISNDINKQNNLEIFLDFKDYKTSKNIKSLIEQEIKNSILYEKGKIKAFIEHLQ